MRKVFFSRKRDVSVRVQQCNFGDDMDKWLHEEPGEKDSGPRGERLAILLANRSPHLRVRNEVGVK